MAAGVFTGQTGDGADLRVCTTLTETSVANFSTVGALSNISRSFSVGEVDVTHLLTDTTNYYWSDFVPGRVSAEISADINHDAGTDEHKAQIYGKLGAMQRFCIVWNDALTTSETASSFISSGFYTGFTDSSPSGDKQAGSLTIRLTGVPVYVGH
jgi:hypothetical protein